MGQSQIRTRKGESIAERVYKIFPNVIVTNRDASYGFQHETEFLKLDLRGFSEKGVLQYIKKLFSLPREKTKLNGTPDALVTLIKGNQTFLKMVQTPLNLDLLIGAYNENRELFGKGQLTTTEVFQMTVRQWYKRYLYKYDTEINKADIKDLGSVVERHDKLARVPEMFETIAYKIISPGSGNDRSSKGYLQELANSGNDRLSKGYLQELAKAKEIDANVFRRLGFIGFWGDEGGFIHGTFLDFFAAKWLVRTYGATKEADSYKAEEKAKKFVAGIRSNPTRRPIFHHAVHLLTNRVGGKPSHKALHRIFSDLNPEISRDHQGNITNKEEVEQAIITMLEAINGCPNLPQVTSLHNFFSQDFESHGIARPINSAIIRDLDVTILWILKHFPKFLTQEDSNKKNAVIFAAEHGKWEMLKAFHGNETLRPLFSKQDSNYRNVAHWAALGGDIDTIKWLHSTYPQLFNQKTYYGETPFQFAAATGNLEALKILYGYNKSLIRATTTGNWTPIHAAVANGHLETVKWLYATQKEVINDVDYNERTLMHRAVANGRLDIAKWLYAINKDLLSRVDYYGWTPLHVAAEYGQVEMGKWILQQMPELINQTSYSRNYYLGQGGALTALDVASKYSKSTFQAWLQSKGGESAPIWCWGGK